MTIQGLQKLTLLDYPGKVACTIFTGGCNFRCPFCHNASLVIDTDQNEHIEEEVLLSFLRKRRGILEGVCISGGEPLLQPDIDVFLRKVKALGYQVKLDTNGSCPEKLQRLVEAKVVDYVAVDIKNSQENYGKTIGIQEYDIGHIHRTVQYLLSGVVPYEFRTTVVQEFHQKSDFESIGRWIQGAEKYYLQKFEDSGNIIQSGLHAYNKDIMNQAIEIVRKYVKIGELRGL